MATLSTSRLVAMVAKVEATYGADPTLAGGTDDVTLIDSENPVSVDIGVQGVQPHTSAFTKTAKRLITTQLQTVRAQGKFNYPAALATVDNGWNGQSALFQSCGITVTAGTPGSGNMTLAPSTKAALKSTYAKIEMDGVVHSVAGMYGTSLEISADTGSNVVPRWTYSGMGLYAEPAIGTISSVTAPDRAASILDATCGITPSGGSAYNEADGLILDSFRLRIPVSVGQVNSVLAPTGISRLLHTDRDPMFEVTLAMDLNDSANLDYEDIHGDLIGSTDHALNILWGSSPGKFEITIPTAQLVGISAPSTKNGYRIITLTYNLRHATANSEWEMQVGNPS